MLDIKLLNDSWFFKRRILTKWEYLFLEWEVDENIYIILSWELIIQKYTDIKKNEQKNLAVIKKNEVFWEASLNNNLAKEVSIKAKTKTELLYISAQNWLNSFKEKYSEEAFNLLKYIIYISNQRLNIANNLITSSFKISNEIIMLEDFKYKTIFNLIEKIKETIKVDEIIYLVENPVMKQYVTLKYKTSIKWIMQDEVIKITDNKLELLDWKTSWKYNYTQNLKISDKNYWFLIFIRERNEFSENEIKIFTTLSTSLAWVLKQKDYLEQQANKEYIKNN